MSTTATVTPEQPTSTTPPGNRIIAVPPTQLDLQQFFKSHPLQIDPAVLAKLRDQERRCRILAERLSTYAIDKLKTTLAERRKAFADGGPAAPTAERLGEDFSGARLALKNSISEILNTETLPLACKVLKVAAEVIAAVAAERTTDEKRFCEGVGLPFAPSAALAAVKFAAEVTLPRQLEKTELRLREPVRLLGLPSGLLCGCVDLAEPPAKRK